MIILMASTAISVKDENLGLIFNICLVGFIIGYGLFLILFFFRWREVPENNGNYCPQCGYELTDDSPFCTYCGFMLNKDKNEH